MTAERAVRECCAKFFGVRVLVEHGIEMLLKQLGQKLGTEFGVIRAKLSGCGAERRCIVSEVLDQLARIDLVTRRGFRALLIVLDRNDAQNKNQIRVSLRHSGELTTSAVLGKTENRGLVLGKLRPAQWNAEKRVDDFGERARLSRMREGQAENQKRAESTTGDR